MKNGKLSSSWQGLVGWLLLCFAVEIVAGLFSPGNWYRSLNKPSWNPPGWVFGPVWTYLYGSMGVAAWLVWRRYGWAGARTALILFVAQLFFNLIWQPIFTGLESLSLALVDLVLIWVLALATAVAFWRKVTWAGILFVPYMLWLSYAAALNFALWRMN